MLLTVCVAECDPQPLLSECIDSVRDVADEILLATPGGIAHASGGVRCLRFDSEDPLDSDSVLNDALAQARGAWFLFLNGFERLDADAADLRTALATASCSAFSLLVRRLLYRLVPGGRAIAPDHPLTHGARVALDRRSVRLFRRDAGYRFGGRVSPSIDGSLHARGGVAQQASWSVLEHATLIPVNLSRTRARVAKARGLTERNRADPDAWQDLGECLMEDVRSAELAVECFSTAWSLRREAASCLGAAHALAAQRRFEEALEFLERDVAACRTGQDDIWELRGEMLRRLNRNDAATAAYAEALALGDDRPAARAGMVEVLCAGARAHAAQPHADWLVRHCPGFAQSWIARALVELTQGHLLSAIDSLRVALDIEPSSTVARYDLAIAYARLGAHGRARKMYEQAREVRGGILLARELGVEPDRSLTGTRLQPLGPAGVVSFIPVLGGGAGRVALDIIRCLATSCRQVLITYERGDFTGMGLLEELEELAVPLLCVGSSSQLAQAFRHLDAAVQIFHSPPLEGTTFEAARDTVRISVNHGRAPFAHTYHDYYVCLSDAHRRDHAYLPDGRVRIIPNGVDLENFRHVEPDPRYWARPHDGAATRIAMLTRLDDTKCTRRLLHCLEPLHDLNVEIAIAGQGGRRWEIGAELPRFRIGANVRFVGPIPSRAVPGFLAGADIGLHLTETDHETLSVSILEMLAAGLPVVSQPRGCLPELVCHGENGFLFESEHEIAAALRRLVVSKELRLAMGAASRARASAWKMSSFTEAWRQLVTQCIAECRRRRAAVPAPESSPGEIALPTREAAELVDALREGRSAERPANFLIAAGPRVGATYLCTALGATGLTGQAREDLAAWTVLRGRSWRYRTLDDFLMTRWHLGASARGVWGTRLAFEHLILLCRSHGTADWPSRWLERIGEPLWISLRRRDRLAQAISWYRAKGSGQWQDTGEPRIGVPEVPYDRNALDACRQRLEQADRAWDAFFEAFGIRPLELVYEDWAGDVEGAVRTVLHALGIEPPDPLYCRSPMLRQADELSREWSARYARGD